MSKYWIEYTEEFEESPLTCWVHKPIDSEVWSSATKFEPDLPQKILGKGYPVYKIEYKSHEFIFSSKQEIDYCISIFSKKVLPTTNILSQSSWMKGYQHLHWSTKWPGNSKGYKDRVAIIKLLEKVRELNT